MNASDRSTFEQIRSYNKLIPDFASISVNIKHAIDNDFTFIYLLNSVLGFSGEPEVYKQQIASLEQLLEKLLKVNCTHLRITNLELVDYINKHYPEFNIHLSTSTEYTQLQQFQNAYKLFPCIKEFIPSYEVNKNFHLLKNLRKNMPNIDVELIADEGCISGCPLRIQHPIKKTIPQASVEEADTIFKNISPLYGYCYKLSTENYNEYLCKSKNIYPWELEYYKKIGCTKFKFVGRGVPYEGFQMNFYKYYMQGVEDPKSIENMNINLFVLRYRYTKPNELIRDYRVRDIRKYLPSIKYFIKNGKDCHYKCGVECNYCEEKAKKIEKVFNK